MLKFNYRNELLVNWTKRPVKMIKLKERNDKFNMKNTKPRHVCQSLATIELPGDMKK